MVTKKNIMDKITSFSTNQQFSTGRFAQRTFEQTGKIDITFFDNQKFIGAEIEGFEIASRFVKNPKTEKHKRQNHWFVVRYIQPCHNATELLEMLNIKNTIQ